MAPRQILMTEDQLQDLVKNVARETVRETLTSLGADVEKPLEMQRDFQHLREWRTTTESVKSKTVLALLTLLVSGTVAAFWVGFKEMVSK